MNLDRKKLEKLSSLLRSLDHTAINELPAGLRECVLALGEPLTEAQRRRWWRSLSPSPAPVERVKEIEAMQAIDDLSVYVDGLCSQSDPE